MGCVCHFFSRMSIILTLSVRRLCLFKILVQPKIFVKNCLKATILLSGGYWVRRMRQLPQALFFGTPSILRAPLENSTYSFNPIQTILSEDLFFFREHPSFGRKIGETKSENTMSFGEKYASQDQTSFFHKQHQFLKILASGP